MRTDRFIVALAGACLVTLALGQSADADILISVNKSTQRMTVTVDGQPRYNWPVSTGKPGYETPSGTFRPFRMDKDHRSEEWDNAPMPYSIFFTMTGDAVHGTNEQRGLGHAVSHGCVRLSVKNAATLWSLVKREKMASTIVQIHGGAAFAEASPFNPGRLAPLTGGKPGQTRRATGKNQARPLFPFFPFTQ